MPTITKKSFFSPDETATPASTVKIETINLGGVTLKKITAQPGWMWSKDLKPIQKSESCQTHHVLYMLSGKLASKMSDGTELEFVSGEVGDIPAGHDGWTVGDEPAVWLELPH